VERRGRAGGHKGSPRGGSKQPTSPPGAQQKRDDWGKSIVTRMGRVPNALRSQTEFTRQNLLVYCRACLRRDENVGKEESGKKCGGVGSAHTPSSRTIKSGEEGKTNPGSCNRVCGEKGWVPTLHFPRNTVRFQPEGGSYVQNRVRGVWTTSKTLGSTAKERSGRRRFH